MSTFWVQLPSLVALAAHVAICVTGVSLVGVAAMWLCRARSAPLRHAVALGFLVALLAVPAIAALYQYRLIRFDFARAPAPSNGPIVVAPSDSAGVAATFEEPYFAGMRHASATNWSYVATAAFALAWFIGCAIGCARTLYINRRQQQYMAMLRPVTDAASLALLARLRRTLGIWRSVRLMSSRDIPWPFTVGLVHPRVIIPSELLQEESRSRLEAVLLHELAHVLRLDCGLAAIEELARLVYWWNPLVAMLTSHLAAAREETCDGYVLAHSGDGLPLAQYLLCSAEKAAHAPVRFAISISWHDPLSLRKRITQLLAGDRDTMIRINSVAVSVLAIATLAASFVVVHVNYVLAAILACSTAFAGDAAKGATVAHWRFEEGTPGQNTTSVGNQLLDSSGNGLHGTAIGAPTFVAAEPALAYATNVGLLFTGRQQVFVPDSPLHALTKSMTVEAFIRVDSLENPQGKVAILGRVDNRAGFDPYALEVITTSNPNTAYVGKIGWRINNEAPPGAGLFSEKQVPLGRTIHVAGTLDDATGAMKLYVDGELVASTVTQTRPIESLDPKLRPGLQIGSIHADPAFAFRGSIDEVRLSDRALNPSEFLYQPVPEPSSSMLGATAMCLVVGWLGSVILKRRNVQ